MEVYLMKRLFLPLLGLVPFLCGWLVNELILKPSPLGHLGYAVGFLVLWFLLAYGFSRLVKSIPWAMVLLHLPAAVVLLLLGVQELILHAYWLNPVGLWTQFFYLPLINLATRLFPWSDRMLWIYCTSFLLLLATALLGCLARRHRASRQKQS